MIKQFRYILTLITLLIAFSATSQVYLDTVCAGAKSRPYSVDGFPGSTYKWTINGGTIAGYDKGSKIFVDWGAIPGSYAISVVETSAAGCVGDPQNSLILVTHPPSISPLGKVEMCENKVLQLNPVVTGDYSSTRWITSGDGKFGDESTLQTSYKPGPTDIARGAAQLSLRVKGMGFCEEMINVMEVKFIRKPTANFTIVNVCRGSTSNFADISLPNGAKTLTYQWSFGDPTATAVSSLVKNISYTYPASGTYTVTHVVTSEMGCSDTLRKLTTIWALPKAAFVTGLSCQGEPTQFNDKTTPGDAPIVTWEWTAHDTTMKIDIGTTIGKNAKYTFNKSGNYTMTLRATDANGCRSSAVMPVKVNPVPISAFSYQQNINNTQGQVQFNNGSIGAVKYIWDFGNGDYSTDETPPAVTYTVDGKYPITLVATNIFECADTARGEYRLLFKGLYVPNAFAPEGNEGMPRIWKPIGINLQSYQVVVYNDYGDIIWSSTKLDKEGRPLESWDGTYRHEPCQQDVYVWKIIATFRDGSVWENKDMGDRHNLTSGTAGTITLIR